MISSSHKIRGLVDTGKEIKVWVLAPFVDTKDEQIDYYYDFSQSIEEYTRVFNSLELKWIWQPVNMNNYKEVVENIVEENKGEFFFPVVLNLCDGDEINGTPGISVIKLLHEKNIVFTGADEYFYNITTSKIPMKRAFDKAEIAHAPWVCFHDKNISFQIVSEKVGTPFIIKPAVSGGSMGVGIKNVIETEEEFNTIVEEIFNGYHGWNLTIDGVIAEKFIAGPEFTVFIVGSHNNESNVVIYTPVERVFHHSLPEKEKFLSFERLWEIYETESSMPNSDNFYEYTLPDRALIEDIKNLSWKAHQSNNGVGYSRIDIRQDKETKMLYVLEVNAQCGISEDENFTSIGAILKASKVSFAETIEQILIDGITRNQKTKTL